MVTFNETSFTIEIPTGGCPVEDWLSLKEEICDLLYAIDPSFGDQPKAILTLLKNLNIDWELAVKMHKVRNFDVKQIDAILEAATV